MLPMVPQGKKPRVYSQVNEINHHKMGEEYPMLEVSLYNSIYLKLDFTRGPEDATSVLLNILFEVALIHANFYV